MNSKIFQHRSSVRYYLLVDGALSESRTGATMCAGCFFGRGTEIECGEGQLYTQMEDGTWLMTGGFPPSDED